MAAAARAEAAEESRPRRTVDLLARRHGHPSRRKSTPTGIWTVHFSDMAEFVKYTLADGSEVLFESAESDLVELHGGQPGVVDGGQLQTRLESVSAAAEQVAESLRSRLAPDEVELEFGLKVAGEMNWWFFVKNQAEGTIKVTLRWSPSRDRSQ